MLREKLISLLVSVKQEIENQDSEVVEDLQELIGDIENFIFEIEDVEIDYQELSSSLIESCLDASIDDNQNFSQVYLDCHISPELISYVDIKKLLEVIKQDEQVLDCDNIYSDCIEIYFKDDFLK